ncbi:citrate lyase acyl carrier protein [Anaerovoracaceae bacterium 41-7]|jgi:citrate lyase subunit gamma (acyl carrier protein)|uniref:citrate lyase acyl carrier protein n=1 Tax=Clostridia TaxID=186801 RepID=UPI00191BECFD|nr:MULTISPECIES: citrate lyase acyl carrier protein [Clostridia]MCI9475122.1 citrate lyase acyl carrier protein [Emergencia sp.]
MIKTNACAGTLESSDIYVEIAPLPSGSGVVLSVTSVVYEQFGAEIEAVIRQTLEELGETDVKVTASDRGAVDCTIRARVETAICRGKGEQ